MTGRPGRLKHGDMATSHEPMRLESEPTMFRRPTPILDAHKGNHADPWRRAILAELRSTRDDRYAFELMARLAEHDVDASDTYVEDADDQYCDTCLSYLGHCHCS